MLVIQSLWFWTSFLQCLSAHPNWCPKLHASEYLSPYIRQKYFLDPVSKSSWELKNTEVYAIFRYQNLSMKGIQEKPKVLPTDLLVTTEWKHILILYLAGGIISKASSLTTDNSQDPIKCEWCWYHQGKCIYPYLYEPPSKWPQAWSLKVTQGSVHPFIQFLNIILIYRVLLQFTFYVTNPVLCQKRKKTIKKEARLYTNAIHIHFYC